MAWINGLTRILKKDNPANPLIPAIPVQTAASRLKAELQTFSSICPLDRAG
jgi:hypothetical protein